MVCLIRYLAHGPLGDLQSKKAKPELDLPGGFFPESGVRNQDSAGCARLDRNCLPEYFYERSGFYAAPLFPGNMKCQIATTTSQLKICWSHIFIGFRYCVLLRRGNVYRDDQSHYVFRTD